MTRSVLACGTALVFIACSNTSLDATKEADAAVADAPVDVPPSDTSAPDAASEASPEAGDEAADPVTDAPLPLRPGSYQLGLTTSDETQQALHTSTARLDLFRNNDSTWKAVIAFPFQPPAAMGTSFDGTTVTLTGDAQGYTVTGEANEQDRWVNIALKIANDGTPISAHATGSRSYHDGGDSACSACPIVGDGPVQADQTPPELALSFPLRRGPVQPLPWDVFQALASEPVGLSASGTLTRAGQSQSFSFVTVQPDAAVAWVGISRLQAVLPWDQVRGAKLHLETQAADDPSGNPSVPATVDYEVLDPGSVVAAQEFDTADGYAAFGGAKHVASGSPCESGGCVDLGTVQSECPVPTAGLALRLGAPGATKVHLRHRVDTQGYYGMSVRLFTLDGAMNVHSEVVAWSKVKNAWSESVIPIPDGFNPEDVGLMITPGSSSPYPNCVIVLGGDYPTHVIVDGVWID